VDLEWYQDSKFHEKSRKYSSGLQNRLQNTSQFITLKKALSDHKFLYKKRSRIEKYVFDVGAKKNEAKQFKIHEKTPVFVDAPHSQDVFCVFRGPPTRENRNETPYSNFPVKGSDKKISKKILK